MEDKYKITRVFSSDDFKKKPVVEPPPIKKCLECKYAIDKNGSYCYCKRKMTRVRMTEQVDCEKYKERIKEWFEY